MNKPRHISPIAMDLGARYTGVFQTTYLEGELPIDNNKAYTICLPEDNDKMTWSQVNRTQTRHRVRSNKRSKHAKRLLKLVVEQLLKQEEIRLDGNQKTALLNALNGLLNRRGYNRIEAEKDLSILESVESQYVAEFFEEEIFDANRPISIQWDALSQNIDAIRALRDLPQLQGKKSDIKKRVTQLLKGNEAVTKEILNEVYSAITLMNEAAADIITQVDYGHKHRREYLQNIKGEIGKDSRLGPLVNALGEEAVWCLAGNISNLQLRTTRWYFNSKDMSNGDLFDPKNLKRTLIRWLKYWRPYTEEEKNRLKESLQQLEKEEDILKSLTKLSPELTIPPYEDQDNRRPPKDQTLLLSPEAMYEAYGDRWKVWVQNLERHNSSLSEGLDEILALYDRKSRLPKTINGQRTESMFTHADYKGTYFLQRLLDRNMKLDPYLLRGLAAERKGHRFEEALRALSSELGSQHVGTFLDFCQHYYEETARARARQGLWLHRDNCLLERSDLNPPHKAKILHTLVGNILGEKLSSSELASFKESVWPARVKGNATLKGLCKTSEETRKKFGNLFNERLRRLRYHIEECGKSEKEALSSADTKEIWKAYQNSLLAAQFIADNLGHDPRQSKRYANPFSMAQLYNLIEKDIRGFSNTTLAIHLENAWRMEEVELGELVVSNCSRLPADSIRPFDGVLKRVLDYQAYKIATEKASELTSQPLQNCILDIPVLIEENRFAFTEELLDLKKAPKAKRDAFSQRLTEQRDVWDEKTNRIKSASKGICPYTGQNINDIGEIDHILPRSASRNKAGTVFNSEANLIWCSRKGNQDKREKVYYLKDLSPVYLSAVFGENSVTEVSKRIESILSSLSSDFIFEALSDEQRAAVRHALFLSEDSPARQKVELKLASQNTARVNGTQAYLARKIIEHLDKMLKRWAERNNVTTNFKAGRINAESVSGLRKQLALHDARLAKAERQSVASHAIDALCVYAQAAASPGLMETLAITTESGYLDEDIQWISRMLPDEVQVNWIERRQQYEKSNIAAQPIFKEGIFAEHFLPVWKFKGKYLIGFEPFSNSIEVNGKSPESLIKVLSPLFDKPLPEDDCNDKPQKATVNRYRAFELLRKVAKEPSTDSERVQADVLEKLRYVTSKKPIWSVVYDQQKSTFGGEKDILKDKDFSIKLSLSNRSEYSCKGTLTLPAIHDWKNVVNHAEIKPLLGSKTKAPDFRKIEQKLFKPGSERHHKKTRRVFSLPRIDNPSGGFRIRRKSPDGIAVWQLHAISNSASAGFAVEQGTIKWDSPVLLSALRKSNNVVPLNGRFEEPPEQILPFNTWLAVDCKDERLVRLELSPRTKSRPYARITQPFDVFQDWLRKSTEEVPQSALELRGKFKVDGAKFAKAHGISLLGKPRGAVVMHQIGDIVSYTYEIASGSSEMRNAMQEAFTKRR